MLPASISRMIASQTETRLLGWMIGIALAAGVGICLSGHLRFAAGFATGAAIAVVGYIWLCEFTAKALDSRSGRLPKMLVFKLVLRYPLLFGALYLFHRTNWLPAWAVLAGLLVPLAGAVTEGFYQLHGMLYVSRTIK